ncbi:MAG: exosortase/archaeosortase family protein [Sedimentisphaerales bacterium]|nr:exosortase/archaeosortase family protein [Sedimentisphaerales bacterium]
MVIPIKSQDTQLYVKKQWCEIGIHNYIKIAIIAGLFIFVFYREMNYLISQWIHDKNWSHGFLIPVFSLFFLYQRKRDIINLEARPNYFGLPLLIAAILFYIFNIASPSGWAYFRSLSMIAAIAATVLFMGGFHLLKFSWLPIAFLIFAVPLPDRFYKSMTSPMRHWAASIAAALLNLVNGIEASVRGAVIDVIYKGRLLEPSLDVAEACSGMRLLMAFLALGVVMAYIHHRPFRQRIILLISTVPIAIFCNIVRVTCTGFIYVFIHPKYTQGIYHDLLGMAMLPLAFGLYGFLAWFMTSLFIDDAKVIREDILKRTKHD